MYDCMSLLSLLVITEDGSSFSELQLALEWHSPLFEGCGSFCCEDFIIGILQGVLVKMVLELELSDLSAN